MKVIISHSCPFALAHGGSQVLIESLMTALATLGVEVEPERWWDAEQSGDILHYVGRPQELNVQLARGKGRKIVMTEFLDKTASRTRTCLWLQRQVIRMGTQMLGPRISRLGWDIYQQVDAMVYVVPWEWRVAQYLFRAPSARGVVIPHGIGESSLSALRVRGVEGDYLISVGTIDPRKNMLLLARAAARAHVPVVLLGKPYAEKDSYFVEFKKHVDGNFVRYHGFVSEEEKCRLLTGARGFVLLSEFESGCLSVFEAAAAGLPLLLPKLPWATESYGVSEHMHFTKLTSMRAVQTSLAEFYGRAHRQPTSIFPVHSWLEIARRYKALYEEVLRRPPSGLAT